MENPFLQPYNTPHGTVPFDKISLVHYEPAIREGMNQEDEEINAIVTNPENRHSTIRYWLWNNRENCWNELLRLCST